MEKEYWMCYTIFRIHEGSTAPSGRLIHHKNLWTFKNLGHFYQEKVGTEAKIFAVNTKQLLLCRGYEDFRLSRPMKNHSHTTKQGFRLTNDSPYPTALIHHRDQVQKLQQGQDLLKP